MSWPHSGGDDTVKMSLDSVTADYKLLLLKNKRKGADCTPADSPDGELCLWNRSLTQEEPVSKKIKKLEEKYRCRCC